jgi:hypothetical protein
VNWDALPDQRRRLELLADLRRVTARLGAVEVDLVPDEKGLPGFDADDPQSPYRMLGQLAAHAGVSIVTPEIGPLDLGENEGRRVLFLGVGPQIVVDAVYGLVPGVLAVLLASWLTRLVCPDDDQESETVYAVALGLGAIRGSAPRLREFESALMPDDPAELGFLLALRLQARSAGTEAWLDVSAALSPVVRRSFEQAHALLTGEKRTDGVPASLRRGSLRRAIEVLRASRGDEPWLHSRLLEPTPRDFPDRWTEDEDGVEGLARRLLGHAGLGELEVEVVVYEDDDLSEGVREDHTSTAAFFAGIVDGTARFGARADLLAEAPAVVGALAHEVAHAYREHHDLAALDQDEEEELTDVTTIFLGFGILSANAAWEYRSRMVEGSALESTWSARELGYLDTEDLAFLLAQQTVDRGVDRRTVRRIAGFLGERQRDAFLASHDVITGRWRPSVGKWLVAAGIALALGGVTWRWLSLAPERAPCRSREECRPFLECVVGRCAPECDRPEDCGEGRTCVTDNSFRRGCVDR